MFGCIIGEIAAFPHELGRGRNPDGETGLLPERGPGFAAEEGRDYSGAAVLTAAVADGLVRFDKKLPGLLGGEAGARPQRNAFEELYREEMREALKSFGRAHPLAGYPMDLSIWLFREDAPLSGAKDAGPAVRSMPVAWLFQDDLYMMRRMAVLQTRVTHSGRETAKAADAAACAVFLALHGCTKDYIRGYMENQFGYSLPGEEALRREILQAGSEAEPSLCVRAALTAFLYGNDFEDVLKRAVSYGGRSAEAAAAAGGIAEAFFGIPARTAGIFRQGLPEDILGAVDAFEALVERRKAYREANPAAKARWEGALTRGSDDHPAAVKGNEPLEEAIRVLNEKRDGASLAAALKALNLRAKQKGRVFVPVLSVKREEGAREAARFRLQTLRTRDGKLWQPAYTSRARLEKARAAMERPKGQEEDRPDSPPVSSGLALSYALDALLLRFIPENRETGIPPANGAFADGASGSGLSGKLSSGTAPSEIEGIVLNPFDLPLFLPRETIRALLAAGLKAGTADLGLQRGL